MEMDEPGFSETLVPIYQNTGTYLPKYMALHPTRQSSDYTTLSGITSKVHTKTIMFVAIHVSLIRVCTHALKLLHA
jgi:hypothetical protein